MYRECRSVLDAALSGCRRPGDGGRGADDARLCGGARGRDPAVVGVHEATRRLQTGQRVRVDGGSGRIDVLGGASV